MQFLEAARLPFYAEPRFVATPTFLQYADMVSSGWWWPDFNDMAAMWEKYVAAEGFFSAATKRHSPSMYLTILP